MTRRPRLLAALIAVVFLVLVGGGLGSLSGKLSSVQENSNAAFLPAKAESTRALAVQEQFTAKNVIPTVVFYERDGAVTAADRARAADDLARVPAGWLRGAPSPVVPAKDGRALQVVLPLDGTVPDVFIAHVKDLRSMLDRPGGPTGLRHYVTGLGGLQADLFAVFGSIDTSLLGATAVVVIVILLLVYRSPVLWIVPLVSAGVAYAAAGGIVYLLAKNNVLTVNGQSQGILTVLVFGAGTDYALLIIARYREELHRFDRSAPAMRAALRGAAPAIVASAATVVLGLLCLLASELSSNKGLGPVSAVGIGCAAVTMLVLLPSLLVVSGRRIFWPRVPHVDGQDPVQTGPWSRVAGVVGRRTPAVAATTVVGLVLLSLGTLQLQASGIPQSKAIRGSAESVVGQEHLGRHFPAGAGSPVDIIAPLEKAAATVAAVKRQAGMAEAVVTAGPDGSPLVKDGQVLVEGVLGVASDGAAAARVISQLRTGLDAVSPKVLVGGFTAIDLDIQDASQRDRRVIIPLVLLVILIVLGLLLRSIVAPVLLVATVVLSFFATLGACALVFRHGFGFPGEDSSFPLFAFVFLVALGIDYNIFLMTRVREETLTLGTRQGMLRGLTVTGGVITSAGVVLAATFGVLGVLPLVFLTELGFAVAFGVLLDTLIVRSLLVPALTLLLGDRVWWPSALSRAGAERSPVPLTEPAASSTR